MENYICINGKKAELTEEQMCKLGIEFPKASPFDRRTSANNKYYTIDSTGEVFSTDDMHHPVDILRYRIANYCTDASILEQRALHETLNRLLWRYSMEHDGDKIDKDFFMVIREKGGHLESYSTSVACIGEVKFYSHEDAKAAIKEIIEPFIKKHPEFKW